MGDKMRTILFVSLIILFATSLLFAGGVEGLPRKADEVDRKVSVVDRDITVKKGIDDRDSVIRKASDNSDRRKAKREEVLRKVKKQDIDESLKKRKVRSEDRKALKRKDAKKTAVMRKEEKCEEISDRVEKALCDKERNAVAERALEKARERHALNEKCRKLAGEDRKKCELEINEHYRTVVQDRFKEWVKKKRLAAADSEGAAEEVEIDEEARVRLHLLHKKMLEEKLQKLTDEKKKQLIQRLENIIEKGEKRAELMERAIAKAEEKGHDVSRLQFLLEEYNSALDKAKVLCDDDQYRDCLAAISDAKHTFKQFRHVFAELHGKHKRGEKHVEDLTEVVEVPPTTEEVPTPLTEGDS